MKKVFFSIALATVATAFGTSSALAHDAFEGEHFQCHATLTAMDSNAQINLRSGPGTDYDSLGYGLVGDEVAVLTIVPPEVDYEIDEFGYGWYRVGFNDSGAKGWIREDLLEVTCDPIYD
ncbi:MAG: SH3 domain-containing protein [Cyanobacteriota bacterium]|nr:SH3 domain-containing protein [Cyanobacteriota bacterium]